MTGGRLFSQARSVRVLTPSSGIHGLRMRRARPRLISQASSTDPGKHLEQARRRAALIYNPVAGQQDPAAILGDVALKLSAMYDLTIMQTTPDMSSLVQRALKSGAELVIASGGDGTVGAVAGELIGTGVPLGIVPRGTANAFSVALGIPTPLDDGDFHKAAADVILQAGQASAAAAWGC
jgi:diacylglycerol kinase (ATP)